MLVRNVDSVQVLEETLEGLREDCHVRRRLTSVFSLVAKESGQGQQLVSLQGGWF